MAKEKIPNEIRTCVAPGCDITFECKVTSKKKFCCCGHVWIGRHHSKGTKKKMAKSASGKVRSAECCAKESAARMGENNPNYGKYRSKEWKEEQGERIKLLYQEGVDMGFRAVPISEEAIKKSADTRRGRKNPEQSERMKKDNPMKRPEIAAKHRGENSSSKRPEVRAKISTAKKGKCGGKNNPNWQGGIGNLPYPLEFNEEFKELVRERYNHTCVICKRKQEQLRRKLGVHQDLSKYSRNE